MTVLHGSGRYAKVVNVMRSTQAKGWVAMLVSAFCFALSTVFVKQLAAAGMPILTITSGRFLLGFLATTAWLIYLKHPPQARNWGFLLGRAVSNLVAVILFYQAIKLTTVTKANLLNMTYPIFVALLSQWWLAETTTLKQWLAIIVGFCGIGFILNPTLGTIGLGDWIGLACGFISAISVLLLRQARQHDDVLTIVWVVMGVGMVILLPSLRHLSFEPHTLIKWGWAAFLGGLGQVLITFGYRFISAVDGSVASSSRIFFAGILGVVILGDQLSSLFLFGAILMVVSLVLLAWPKRADEVTS